jgi:hypothetical protein
MCKVKRVGVARYLVKIQARSSGIISNPRFAAISARFWSTPIYDESLRYWLARPRLNDDEPLGVLDDDNQLKGGYRNANRLIMGTAQCTIRGIPC